MDTAWWLALGAVVLLAFVAALIDGRGRLGPRRRAAAVRKGRLPEPRPGEIWQTSVPREGELPCLVLVVRTDGARVARVVGGPPADDRPGALPLPEDTAGTEGGPCHVTADELAEIGLGRLVRRTGEVGPETWDRVRHLAE